MRPPLPIKRFAAGSIACVMFCCLLARTGWSQTDSHATPPDLMVEELLWAWQTQAALQLLQAQQEATLQAIEITRNEIAASLSRSVDSTLMRLDAMNEVLVTQRESDLAFIRDSNRRILLVISSLTGLLFLGMLVVTLISTRAMNRLTMVLSASPFALAQLNAPRASLAGLLTESGAAQLQTAIERLERRIAELENHSPQQASPEAKVQAVQAA